MPAARPRRMWLDRKNDFTTCSRSRLHPWCWGLALQHVLGLGSATRASTLGQADPGTPGAHKSAAGFLPCACIHTPMPAAVQHSIAKTPAMLLSCNPKTTSFVVSLSNTATMGCQHSHFVAASILCIVRPNHMHPPAGSCYLHVGSSNTAARSRGSSCKPCCRYLFAEVTDVAVTPWVAPTEQRPGR